MKDFNLFSDAIDHVTRTLIHRVAMQGLDKFLERDTGSSGFLEYIWRSLGEERITWKVDVIKKPGTRKYPDLWNVTESRRRAAFERVNGFVITIGTLRDCGEFRMTWGHSQKMLEVRGSEGRDLMFRLAAAEWKRVKFLESLDTRDKPNSPFRKNTVAKRIILRIRVPAGRRVVS